MSLNACKSFFEKTGLDLQSVFLDYMNSFVSNKNLTTGDRVTSLNKLYTRDLACKAMHCMIKESDSSIPMLEIEDATYRVGWLVNDKLDNLSEPWSMVMVQISFMINEYMMDELNIKKSDTSEE